MNKNTEKLQLLLTENAIGEEEFAYCLGITEKQAKQFLSGQKTVSQSLARQIEQTFSKPKFWLSTEAGEEEGPNFDLFG